MSHKGNPALRHARADQTEERMYTTRQEIINHQSRSPPLQSAKKMFGMVKALFSPFFPYFSGAPKAHSTLISRYASLTAVVPHPFYYLSILLRPPIAPVSLYHFRIASK